MNKEQAIEGLKKGRVLHLDGWATDDERAAIQELIDEGFAETEFIEEDQYSYHRITLKK